jgi:acylphosphatase
MSSDGEICKQILVVGKVQGVGFRNACFHEVKRLGELKGWVRNLNSGDVEIIVQGSPEKIKELVSWCHTSPVGRVDAVLERDVRLEEGLSTFGIRKL